MGWEWRGFIPLANEDEHHFQFNLETEKRLDIYYVESEKIGVKKRNSVGDYEVKSMQDSTYYGAEKYIKYIVPEQMGDKYNSYVAVQVHKERQKQIHHSKHGSVIFEMSFVCAKDRWWKSICWEGSPSLIYDEVKKYFELMDGWTKSSINLPNGGITCGYPQWIATI